MKRLGLLTLFVLIVSVFGAAPVRRASALVTPTDAPDWDVRGGWTATWSNGSGSVNLTVTSEDFATGALGGSGTITVNGVTTPQSLAGSRAFMSTVFLPVISVNINPDGSLGPLPNNPSTPGLTVVHYSATPVQREFVFSTQPQSVVAGAIMAPVVVTVQLTTGEVLTNFEDRISMHLGAGVPGGITGTVTQTPVNGVATFNDLRVSVPFSGAQLMAVVANRVFNVPVFDPVPNALSAPFDIHGSQQLAFVSQPQSVPPGTAMAAVSVAVQDASLGSTITSAGGNVTLSFGANPGGSTLSGTTTQPLVAGVATFTGLSLDKAATGYTLFASDSDSAVDPATSLPFDVTGPHLVFSTQPQSTLPGKALDPVKVTAVDASGTTLTKSTGTVTLSLGSDPSGATLAGTVIKPLVKGVATFNGLKLDRPGTGFTLVATDSDVTVRRSTSAAFDVNAQLTLVAPPDHFWANGHVTATVRATLVDDAGNPIDASNLHLVASPATGVKIEKPHEITDTTRAATFLVSSTEIGVVTLSVTDAKLPGISATATVSFDRHKVLVEAVGIRTGLQCAGAKSADCQVLDDTQQLDVNGFAPITAALVRQQGFVPDDMLWYSYTGGQVDHATGLWHPHDYQCSDTAENYRVAIGALRQLIVRFADDNPNTDLYIVAHSQGGLIAFQSLGLLDKIPANTTLKAVITLDSPLGGSPQTYVSLAADHSCWKGPANDQMVKLYDSTTLHTDQGSTATILCGMLGDCPLLASGDNNFAAAQASNANTQVITYGNLDDAVYRASSCSPLPYVDNTSTEVVDSAGGGLASLGTGGASPDPLVCASQSHGQVYSVHAVDILKVVGQQTSVTVAAPNPGP